MCPNEGASTVVQEIEGRTGKDGMCVDSPSGNLPLTFLHSYELVRARASEKVDKSTSNLESKKS